MIIDVIIHVLQPYSRTDRHVVLKRHSFKSKDIDCEYQILSRLQNADHVRAFQRLKSVRLLATMDPRQLKWLTCFNGSTDPVSF